MTLRRIRRESLIMSADQVTERLPQSYINLHVKMYPAQFNVSYASIPLFGIQTREGHSSKTAESESDCENNVVVPAGFVMDVRHNDEWTFLRYRSLDQSVSVRPRGWSRGSDPELAGVGEILYSPCDLRNFWRNLFPTDVTIMRITERIDPGP
jgi:hypothetical protein